MGRRVTRTAKSKQLFFNDGHVFEKDRILIASQLEGAAGSHFSRISMIIDGKWSFEDFDDVVLSVTALPERVALYMGHGGNILAIGEGRKIKETLPDVPKYGNILRIRTIGDRAYVCGMTGMVYQRGRKGWSHMDEGLLGKDGLEFEDMGGTGPDDIYAVGLPGSICHYDGKRWRRLEIPTDRPLSGVKVISKDEVYVCGDDGLVFEGNRKGWKSIGPKDPDLDFWGIDVFQGNVYVAHDGGLMVRKEGAFEEVNFGLKGGIDCHRLHANDGVLWSFGIDTLLAFDGMTWRRVNQPKTQ